MSNRFTIRPKRYTLNMGDAILTWNVPNFVTVCLMVALGAFLYVFLSKSIRAQKES